jgi:hypothetical protein
MLDLEYLAGSANAVVVQIGAMPFAIRTGEYDPSLFFSVNLSVDEQLRAGRKIDARTLEWWMGQAVEKGAVPPWFKDQRPVRSSLVALTGFLESNTDPRKLRVWSHINCDVVKIGDLCLMVDLPVPFLWKNCEHIHTLVHLSGVKPPKHTASDHEAINDCVRQIRYSSECWKTLDNARIVR